MAGEYLLDTNILIAYLQREQDVLDRIHAADVILVPPVVLGELYFGAAKSRHAAANLSSVERLLTWAEVAVCDERTGAMYGTLKFQLRSKGRMIPDNDIWVAAAAIQQHVTLVSRDYHFTVIDHLRREAW